MCIADPRESADNAYSHENGRHNTSKPHRSRIIRAIFEYQDQAEDQPRKSRGRATRMDATQVLESRSTAETEPQRRPLRFQNMRNVRAVPNDTYTHFRK